MKIKNRNQFIREYGAKATIVSEIFKENELNGKTIKDTQIELLADDICSNRMLHEYTKGYIQNKDSIGWMNYVGKK